MSYQHLTLEERYCPAEFREKGLIVASGDRTNTQTIAVDHQPSARRNREKSGYQWTASLLPKGCNFLDVSQAEFDRVLDLINHRPRKRLAWLSSFDVFLRLLLLLDNLPKASAIPSFPRARKKLTCARKKSTCHQHIMTRKPARAFPKRPCSSGASGVAWHMHSVPCPAGARQRQPASHAFSITYACMPFRHPFRS